MAGLLEVAEDTLHALLMEILMFTIGQDIAEQRRVIQCGPAVVQPQRCPIGLTGYWAQRTQEVTVQPLLRHICGRALQHTGVGLPPGPAPGSAVNAQPIGLSARQSRVIGGEYCQRNLTARGGTDIPHNTGQGGSLIVKHRVVEGIQIQLERLGLHQVRRAGGNGETPYSGQRLVLAIQPGQLVGMPDVNALEGKLLGQTQRSAPFAAGDGIKQFRRILGGCGYLLAQQQRF